MKKWILVVFVLLSQNAFSQNSFKVQVDTSFKIVIDNAKITSCVDGGIAIAGINNDPSCFIYKADLNGNYLWSKFYNQNMTGPVSYNGVQLKASNDSGFYLLSEDQLDMFGWFSTPQLQKINKDGIVTSSAGIGGGGGLSGNNLYLGAVEKFNNNLFGLGYSSAYDASNDVVCCYQSYGFKLDTTLVLLRRTGYDYLFYDSLDVPFTARNKKDTSFFWNGFELFDTSGNHFSTIQYTWDTMQVSALYPIVSCQDNSNFYFLEQAVSNNINRICIHKVDKNFNTVFAILLDTSSSMISFNNLIGNSKMDKSNDGNLLISAMIGQSYNRHYPFMMEIDTSGNILHAWKGDGADSSYLCCAIDTISGSVLFASQNKVAYNAPFFIERELVSSPSCSYIPVTINTFPISIIDSFFVASDTLIDGLEPNFGYPTVPEVNFPLGPGYPLCGVLSGNHDPSPTGSCIPSIYPNPANDKINITFNCEINQKAEVKIFNIIGDEVFSKNISTSTTENIFDVSELPAGIYLVKSQSGDKAVFNSKIVIQK